MWQRQAKYCPSCGGGFEAHEVGGRPRKRCRDCGFVLYTNPASGALGVVLNARAEVLLVKRGIEPFRDHWALPAGYQEIDEEPRDTVVREVREETGVEVEVCGLLDLLFVPDDPRKPANVAVFLCRAVGGALRAGNEEREAGWFPLDSLPDPIGFDNYPRILKRLVPREGYPESPWTLLERLLDEGRSHTP